jgi:hypothetical protein
LRQRPCQASACSVRTTDDGRRWRRITNAFGPSPVNSDNEHLSFVGGCRLCTAVRRRRSSRPRLNTK